jgi:uncharacterized protein YpmS
MQDATVPDQKPRSKHRGRNIAIGVVIAIVLLIAAFFIVDRVVRSYAEGQIKDQVATAFDLPSTDPVSVDLGDGSLILQAATGTISDATITVDPLTLDGVTGAVTMSATNIPLDKSKPIEKLTVDVSIPTSSVESKISEIPIVSSLNPKVAIDGQKVELTGSFSLFGAQIPVGMTLTPGVKNGEPTIAIDSASVRGVTVSIDAIETYIPALSQLTGASLCIADALPKQLVLTDLTLTGDTAVYTLTGDGASIDSLSQKGTCPSK